MYFVSGRKKRTVNFKVEYSVAGVVICVVNPLTTWPEVLLVAIMSCTNGNNIKGHYPQWKCFDFMATLRCVSFFLIVILGCGYYILPNRILPKGSYYDKICR